MENKKETLSKNDFIEIQYTGKVKNGNVFDSNIQEDIKKLNLDFAPGPLNICLGQNMILPALDEFLIGKEIGEYKVDLLPEKAFGERKKDLIKIMPLSVFKKQDIFPQPGMVFAFDNMPGRVSTVSGGRVIVDFNNPIAGKPVEYELKIKRKIIDEKEKVQALLSSYFKQSFDFEIKNKKLLISVPEQIKQFVGFFGKKFKEVLDLELEVIGIKQEEKKQEKTPETKQEKTEEVAKPEPETKN